MNKAMNELLPCAGPPDSPNMRRTHEAWDPMRLNPVPAHFSDTLRKARLAPPKSGLHGANVKMQSATSWHMPAHLC